MKTLEGGRFNNSNYLEENGEGAWSSAAGEINFRNNFCDSVSDGRGAITRKLGLALG